MALLLLVLVFVYGLMSISSSLTYNDLRLSGSDNTTYDGVYKYYKTIYSPIKGLVWYDSSNKRYLYPWHFSDPDTVSWRIGKDYTNPSSHISCGPAYTASGSDYYAILDNMCYSWYEYEDGWTRNYAISAQKISTPEPTPQPTSSPSSGFATYAIIAAILLVIILVTVIVFVCYKQKKIQYGDQYRAGLLNINSGPQPKVIVQQQQQPMHASAPSAQMQYVSVSQGQQPAMVYTAPQSQAQPQVVFTPHQPQQPQQYQSVVNSEPQQTQPTPPPAYKEINTVKAVDDDKMTEMQMFLKKHNLEGYESALHEIGAETLEDLNDLDDEEIKEAAIDAGIKDQHQQQFINACKELKNK